MCIALPCPVFQLPKCLCSQRTGFSVQQVSRERGHASFLIIQTLFFLSQTLSFMTALVAL